MLKIIFLIIFTLTISLPSLVCGYDQERANVNLASDYATCSAFYIIASEGLRRTGNDNTAEQSMQASGRAYEYAVQLSNQKVTQSRIILSVEELRREMDHDFSNFSILINKYGELCKEILQSPENRMKYWLEKKD